jgi:hypothetical protein
MIQVRKGVFETNSSSTHSIAIPRECDTASYLSFHVGEFGWGWDEEDPVDYFYTALYTTSDTMEELEKKMERLRNILRDYGIEAHFAEVECEERDGWLDHDGYIDHGYELKDFVDELLDDGAKLVRFLSGGLVFTGNDNSESDGFVARNEEFIEDYDWKSNKWFTRRNEYYMADCDDYEWYSKGN